MPSRDRPAASPWRLTLLPLASALLGCLAGPQPPLGRVCGTVTLDGRPLADATVMFTPAGRGRTSMGITDATGHYELCYLRTIRGANVDRHAVRITTANDRNGGRETLPSRYHARTELAARVKAGRNTLDFSLRSDRTTAPPATSPTSASPTSASPTSASPTSASPTSASPTDRQDPRKTAAKT